MHEIRGGGPALSATAAAAAAAVAAVLLLASVVCSAAATAQQDSTFMHLSRAELARIAGYGEERLSSVLVTGALVCDACFLPGPHLRTSNIRGAKVAVACEIEEKRRKINWAYGTTDEYGEFIVDLPSHLHAIPRLDKDCAVRILHIPNDSHCRPTSHVNPRRIWLSSVGNSIRVYTTGAVRLSNKQTPANACAKAREGDKEDAY
ncbi:uncharacterized protein LOC109718056 [Ananas comosus]|uniref:Uncharacterized protein LOC109718056 n=1 Tax=Ananas comosus TaxID=4615 RepID=A0A199VHW9_ANACO|nr:uncharacterized protein LOC109718056 [Ananas comosus]OAY76732.1 hypothetical protein ACMD2_07368 [Ananas comosus]